MFIGFDNQVGRCGRDVELAGFQVGGGGGGLLEDGNAFLPCQLPDGQTHAIAFRLSPERPRWY